MPTKIPHSIKLSRETHGVIEDLRLSKKPVHTFNYAVEALIENSPEFIQHKLQMEARKKARKK